LEKDRVGTIAKTVPVHALGDIIRREPETGIDLDRVLGGPMPACRQTSLILFHSCEHEWLIRHSRRVGQRRLQSPE
jgi:hypothetical protein